MKFTELDLDEGVQQALAYMHYGDCTPVQEQAIPPVLAGDDVIAVAQTGTGKTAAYLLPILSNLNRYRYPTDAINCVIMAPTRELAQQIDQQMQGFSYFVDASSVAVYGGGEGHDFAMQEKGLRQGADVVIATPGRLISHINLGYVDLSQVAFFVLDEADRMLDMGFYDDIMSIAKLLPPDCQKVLYSATMPPKTQRLAEAIMYRPVVVKIAVSKPADKIHQQVCVCYPPQKVYMLVRILRQFFGGRSDGFVSDELLHNPERRVVVFVSRKVNVKDVVLALRRKGFAVASMHSDLSQEERGATMNAFKAGRINVLVATDIVSRGIDITGIELVVNYDMPHDPEDYVHRVGRTARADRDGESVLFVCCNDRRQMREFAQLEAFVGKRLDRIPVPAELGGCEVGEAEGASAPARRQRSGRGHDRGERRRGGQPARGEAPAGQPAEAEASGGGRRPGGRPGRGDRRRRSGSGTSPEGRPADGEARPSRRPSRPQADGEAPAVPSPAPVE